MRGFRPEKSGFRDKLTHKSALCCYSGRDLKGCRSAEWGLLQCFFTLSGSAQQALTIQMGMPIKAEIAINMKIIINSGSFSSHSGSQSGVVVLVSLVQLKALDRPKVNVKAVKTNGKLCFILPPLKYEFMDPKFL